MLIVTFLSMLFKLFHFWTVIGQGFGRVFPNLLYLSVSMVELISFFFLLKLIKNSTARIAVAITANLTLGALITANYLYMRVFRIPLSFSIILFVNNIGNISDSVFALIKPFDVSLYTVDFLLLIILLFKPLRKRFAETDNFFLSIPNKYVISSLIVFVVIWCFNVEPQGSWKEPFAREEMQSLLTFSPIGYCVQELTRLMVVSGKMPAKIKANLGKILDEEEKLNKNSSIDIPFLNKNKKLIFKPNVILVQFESLMSDFLNERIDGIEVLPHINKLINQSVYLHKFCSDSISTADSEFSMFTSLLPDKIKIAHLSFYKNDFESVPSVLKRHGYSTLYANAATRTFWNHENMSKKMGFEHLFFKENLAPGTRMGPWLCDRDFFNQMLSQIENLPKPVFAMLLTISSHYPFHLKGIPKTISTVGKTGDELERRQYANAIHYVDDCLGEFIERLGEKGILKNSILLIYGDHPMVLNYQRKRISKQLGKLPSLDKLVQFFDSNVPCLIYAPNILKPKVINKYCGQIDLGPTILSILGVKKPRLFLGKSIFTNTPGFDMHKFLIGQTKSKFFYGHFLDKDGFRYCYDKSSLKRVKQSEDIDRIFNITKASNWILKYNYH